MLNMAEQEQISQAAFQQFFTWGKYENNYSSTIHPYVVSDNES
jgi:hypothetical protein